MLRNVAKIFGIFFVVIGILGFFPGLTHHKHFLGIFQINAAHNVIHLIIGIVAFAVSRVNTKSCRLFFQIFGVVYTLIGIIGFWHGTKPLFGFLANNLADAWFHFIVGLVSLYLGFVRKKN